MNLRDIARALHGEVAGQQVLAPGPGHSRKDRSLSITLDATAPDGFLVHSFGGNDPLACKDYVRREMGLPAWEPNAPKTNGHVEPQAIKRVAEYVYKTAEGEPYLRVTRMSDKSFRQAHWTGAEWRSGKPDGPKIPYRLPELMADADSPVFVVEGEKDADRLITQGLLATTSSEGAGKWTIDVARYLADRDVFVIPDNDDAGRTHAAQVLDSLPNAKLLTLAGLGSKQDVSDWLDKGHDADELIELALSPSSSVPAVADDDVDFDGVKITEDLIARLFVRKYAGEFAYDHSRGSWFRFDGFVWRICEVPTAFQAIRDLSRWVSDRTKTEATLQKVRFVKGAEEFSRGDKAMSRTSESWNRDPFLLGTPGGTVDLRTGALRASSAADGINRATAISPAFAANCPLWTEFLRQATDDNAELIRFLQQMCGYSLTGDTREQALFFIHGPGGNGKGVFLNTFARILADYSATATMDVLTSTRAGGATTDLAMLNGARLVSASENEEGQPWAEARIKRMTGGDPITARFMRQDNVTFTPVFKLVVAGNYQPTLRNVDEAMRRRFNLIPFVRTPERKDDTLEARLREEWPAILRWMIDGCLDWQQHGLLRPSIVTEATKDYFEDQDSTGLWLETKCRVERQNSHLFEGATSLFQSWKAFSLSIGEPPGTQKTFSENLNKLGFHKKKTNHGAQYHGIELNREPVTADY